MKTARLASMLLALSPFLLTAAAEAAVESKFSFRGQTADAYFTQTSSDGCRVTSLGVLTNELREKLSLDPSMQKVEDVFGVVTLTIYDSCDETGLAFGGYADTTLEGNTFSLVIDPQHDTARFQARLIMQEDGFTFYWIDIDVSWVIGGPETAFEYKDYVELGDGLTAYRAKGSWSERPARAVASVSVVPYFPGAIGNHPYVGDGISFTMDSIDTPEEYQSFNRYSDIKTQDRILYRSHEYVPPTP